MAISSAQARHTRAAHQDLFQTLESRILMDGAPATATVPLTLRRSVAADTHWMLNGSRLNGAVPLASASPAAAPINLTGTALSPTSVTLAWNYFGSKPSTFFVFASINGGPLTRLGQTSTGSARSATVSNLASGTKYAFTLQSVVNGKNSPNSNYAAITTSLAAPTNLTASAASPSAINLKWSSNEKALTGFQLLRSTDGTTFTPLITLSASTKTYTDSNLPSLTTYSYRVLALKNTLASANSNTASATTSLAAPTALTATASSASITLNWSAAPSATGYNIFRAPSGTTTFAKIASTANLTYADTPTTAGTYTYKIQASANSFTSAFSNTASATFATPTPTPTPEPTPTPTPTPTPSTTGTVTVATRYTNELVVTASTGTNTVLVAQSGSILNITANGTTTSYALPAGGLFLYARGAATTFTINAGVTLRTIVAAIDNAATSVSSAASNLSAWLDSTDSFTGTGTLHSVAAFAGGVSKATAAALANPSDAGATKKVNASLFGIAGPVATDINQGSVGDCYFLSSLAAFANGTSANKAKLLESAVDLGDGTFVVNFKTSFVRISNDFSTGYFSGGLKYAHPGAAGTIWAMVMEKAFCYFRTGANTYNSINSGWMGEAYSLFNVTSSSFTTASLSDANLFTKLSTALAAGKPVTFGTSSTTTLVQSHAYTLISATKDANGNAVYVVRNPWGSSGAAPENASGYATLSYTQLLAAFNYGCVAT